MAKHLSAIGMLWIVYSILHLLPALGAVIMGSFGWPFVQHVERAVFVGPMIAVFAGMMGLVSVVGIIAGWGLLSRRPWARILLLVLAFLSLLSIPFGTILGAYTLWVLLPGDSERELNHLARKSRGHSP